MQFSHLQFNPVPNESVRSRSGRRNTPLIAGLLCFLAGCGQSGTDTSAEPPSPETIATSSIIVDTHIDVPIRLVFRPADVTQATDGGQFDYPRAVAGGLNAAFMSIYTPAAYAEEDQKSYDFANELIDMVEGIVESAPDKFAIATSVADVRSQFDAGLVSLPLGMENGSPLEGKMENLRFFYDRGIRYITLTHSLSNRISDSSYDENRQWSGLSEFGTALVGEMNRIGMMIDVSHVSDDAFWQVMDLSEAPVIASHSSARHFTPDFERNMSNAMIERLAENGGLIMINFGSSFLTEEALTYGNAARAAWTAYVEENPDEATRKSRDEFFADYAQEKGPYPYATLDDVLDHIDHAVQLTSVEHVGIGSDYDGVGDTLPTGLKDVSSFPNLVSGLRERGYSDHDIQKILGENLLRVWSAVEAYAASSQDEVSQ